MQTIHIQTLTELSKLNPDSMRKLAGFLCSWASLKENSKRRAAAQLPEPPESEEQTDGQ